MFDVRATFQNRIDAVEKAAKKGAFRNFGHAGASIRKDVVGKIEKSPEPSPPGQPPHSRRGLLGRAIRYEADEEGLIEGPRASVVGEAGAAHEHGGEYRGGEYDERPFMRPGLARAIERIPDDWRGSIGE